MADKKITELAVASAPTGAELMEIVQGGVNKQTTLQDVADLAAGGVTSVNTQTGAVVLDAGDIANTPAGGIAATTVQAAVNELDTEKAPLASPTFTGTPAAPTPSAGDNSTKIATTAYVDALTDAELTALANLAPANGDFIFREGGVWVKKTTAETAAIIYAVAGDPAFITCLAIHADAGVGLTLTDQANLEQPLANSARTRRFFDATGYNFVQISCHVGISSASANTPKIYVSYSTDNTTYTVIGSGTGTEIISLSSTGYKNTDWIALPALAKALVYFAVMQNGGDGAADPQLGYVELRFKK